MHSKSHYYFGCFNFDTTIQIMLCIEKVTINLAALILPLATIQIIVYIANVNINLAALILPLATTQIIVCIAKAETI